MKSRNTTYRSSPLPFCALRLGYKCKTCARSQRAVPSMELFKCIMLDWTRRRRNKIKTKISPYREYLSSWTPRQTQHALKMLAGSEHRNSTWEKCQKQKITRTPRKSTMQGSSHGSCFGLFGRTRTPLNSSIIFYTMLDNPRMTLDLLERDSLRGIKNKKLDNLWACGPYVLVER